ncbi:hypothetical protein JVT61DRAFT_1784 [Boletus reticuloceps]|uniref:Uncharacterized protein n=1 Tax=Boletus reticuloceps TaxID=495285 RepID=A0A8I2YU36_9AGAM|nr:hypothetical protein JVT61DRAFT_1784 [Boletus reticuloceps]
MELSGDLPSIQQRIYDARDGVGTESRIPDFTAFALRHNSLPHRRLICIIEIKPRKPIPRSELQGAAPQIITQAKFTFDTFPDLRHVMSILALGDTWCLFRFSRDDVTQMYLKNVGGWKDDDTFDPARTAARPRNIAINQFIIIPFSKVLKDDGLDYSSAFQRAIRLITSDLKAGADSFI